MPGRFAVALIALLLPLGQVAAQGVILPERVIAPEPMPVPPGTIPLRTQNQHITARLRDGAATTVVEQTFRNQYNHRIEGTFLFPLPQDASVTDFAMTVNGELVGAELLDAAKAKRIYEEIVRRQKDPGLLEYLGRDLFRARIFPIEPGETKKVRLEYTQAVPIDNGLAEWTFPLKSRGFIPPPIRPLPHPPHPLPRLESLDDRDEPGSRRRPSPATISSLSLEVTIESGQPIKTVYSPSHEIDIHRDGERKVVVGFEQQQVVPDQDFTLFYQFSEANFGLNLLTYRGGDEDGYFLILLAPKSDLRESEIQAKDIVFVFDTSGSMRGEKIQQAKGALLYCIDNLNDRDRFNLVTFSTGVDPLRPQLMPVAADSRREARDYVEQIEARGGTNIDGAFEQALAMLPDDSTRPAMVVFLTDGLPTAGETAPLKILDNVGRRNKAEARVFAFGVGEDVNTILLDRLSNDNHGTRTYVKPGQDIEAEVSNLYAKITSPVLSDLKLAVQGVRITDLQPLALPDLFRGSQVTLLGRYQGAGPAQVVLKGQAGGQEEVFEYSADFPRRDRQHSFIPRLWATRRIGYLLDQIRLHGQEKELIDEVVELATRFGILTPYTSYLVVEPGMDVTGTAAEEALRRRQVAPGPAGPMGPRGEAGPAGGRTFGAPAPTDATTGGGAIQRSEGEVALRDANQTKADQSGLAIRNAGARTFYQVDDRWVESTYPKDPGNRTVIRVKYGSDAWYELLGLRADLPEVLAVGEKVQATFGEVLLVVDTDGAEALSDAMRKALAE